jgi:lipopolysaccharide export system permease protein
VSHTNPEQGLPAEQRRPNERRRPGWTLTRHILGEMTGPVFFALLVLTIIVLTEDMLAASDLVLNRGIPAQIVASMTVYRLVPAIAWMLPFAVLMGSLIALGRLGADRELLVLEASGISSPRLVPPVLVLAAIATAVGFALTLVAAPAANRALDETLERLAQEKPWAAIQPGRVNRFGDWKLQARDVSDESSRLGSVQLWMPDVGETLFAEKAHLDTGESGGPRIRLENGSVFLAPHDHARQLRFEGLEIELPPTEQRIRRKDRDLITGLSWDELSRDGSLEAAMHRQRRVASPIATLLFGALALPLFLNGARFSRSGGWVLGFASIVVYYGLAQLSSGLSKGGQIGAVLGIWLPNLVFGSLALVLVLRLTRMSAFGRHLARPTTRRTTGTSETSGGIHPRPLLRYVATRFLGLALLCFVAILVSYVLVDVLERLDRFTKYGAGSLEVLNYYQARIPLLMSRVFPMSLLVATALTVSVFASHGELVGMRSCGISAPRALFPIVILCAVLVPLYFLFTDQVIPRTNALADHVNDTEIKDRGEKRKSVEVWFRDGSSFYEAALFDPEAGVARDITVYELGDDGMPTSRTDASLARHVGGGQWLLRDHVRVEVRKDGVWQVPTGALARLGETAVPEQVDTRHLSVGELRQEIDTLEIGGVDTTAFQVDLYVKLATPFACLVLPALALFFALGGPPHPGTAATLVFSAVAATAFTLLTGLAASLGYGKVLGPGLAGFVPVAVFAAAAGVLGLRLSVFR